MQILYVCVCEFCQALVTSYQNENHILGALLKERWKVFYCCHWFFFPQLLSIPENRNELRMNPLPFSAILDKQNCNHSLHFTLSSAPYGTDHSWAR